MFIRSVAATCCLALALMLEAAPSIGAASSNKKFAAISVDAKSGRVLYASAADARRFPASLTKMMTLYIMFEELRAGRIARNSTFQVSARAAGREPSKLGLKKGQKISVDNAVRALVTKSANDVATTVAENISGSVSAFAKRMTTTARRLGMSRTTFRNASGLPDPNQVTTARDMALLGVALLRDFPREYSYFSQRSFKYRGRSHANHNRLLGKYPGVDGIKTGYIRASGFNLVASARRGGRRVVAVVMGGRSAKLRNDYMVELLNQAFGTGSRSGAGTRCRSCSATDRR